MTFTFACRHCGHENHAHLAAAGRVAPCSGCGRDLLIPAPAEPAGGEGGVLVSGAALRFDCPRCGRRFSTGPELAGQKVRCGGCGGGVRVPEAVGARRAPAHVRPDSSASAVDGRHRPQGPRPPAPDRPERPPARPQRLPAVERRPEPEETPPPLPLLGDGDPFDLPKPEARGGASLPAVGEETPPPLPPLGEDDPFDLPAQASRRETPAEPEPLAPPPPGMDPEPRMRLPRASSRKGGEPVETVLPSRTEKMAEIEAELAAKAEAAARRVKRKERFLKKLGRKQVAGGMDMADVGTMLAFSVVSVTVLGGLAYGYPGIRFPMGGLLAAGGFVIYLLGTAGFASVARDEGAHYSLMCKFVPLYKWYYLATRWDEMKGHFVFFAVGLILMWPGAILIKTSPVGAKAEASEKAYQALQKRQAEPPLPPVAPLPAAVAGGGE